MLSITRLDNGNFSINGEELTIAEIVSKKPELVAEILTKTSRSRDEKIKKTADTEYSRAKRMHRYAELDRIAKENPEIGKQVKPFKRPFADFIAEATAKVDAGKGQQG